MGDAGGCDEPARGMGGGEREQEETSAGWGAGREGCVEGQGGDPQPRLALCAAAPALTRPGRGPPGHKKPLLPAPGVPGCPPGLEGLRTLSLSGPHL